MKAFKKPYLSYRGKPVFRVKAFKGGWKFYALQNSGRYVTLGTILYDGRLSPFAKITLSLYPNLK